jgi:hypothetical protein
MSGLMRRLTRGRAATDDEATPQASAEPVDARSDAQSGDSGVPAASGGGEPPTGGNAAAGRGEPAAGGNARAGGGEPATAVSADQSAPAQPAPTGEQKTAVVEDPRAAGLDLPAGVDPDELASVPASERRGRLRRRLRYLRAVREVLLRDLGGFYFEAQRSEQGVDAHRRLLEAKANRLATLDAELRELESRLGEAPATTVLREPGLGGTCPHCGELHGSDARFCSRCGHPLTRRAARAGAATPAPSSPAREQEKATTASLWGRPKRPDVPAGGAIAAAGGDGVTSGTAPAASGERGTSDSARGGTSDSARGGTSDAASAGTAESRTSESARGDVPSAGTGESRTSDAAAAETGESRTSESGAGGSPPAWSRTAATRADQPATTPADEPATTRADQPATPSDAPTTEQPQASDEPAPTRGERP